MKKMAVLLDFYGTVVHEDDKIITEICKRISLDSKSHSSAKEIGEFWWRRFTELFTKSHGNRFQTQRDLELTSLENTLTHFGSNQDAFVLSTALYEHWMKPEIFDDSKVFLESLDIPVCIVSNIDHNDILKAIDYHESWSCSAQTI